MLLPKIKPKAALHFFIKAESSIWQSSHMTLTMLAVVVERHHSAPNANGFAGSKKSNV